MEYKGLFISTCPDVGENKGGYYCQVYSDKDMEHQIDDFCVFAEEMRKIPDVDHWIREHIDGPSAVKRKTDFDYGDFPTLEEIRTDYSELIALIKDVRTIEQVKALEQAEHLGIEINGMSIDEFENGLNTINGRSSNRGTDIDIEWIRYERFGCLAYVYDRFDGNPVFDVWCNAGYTEFITDVHIDDVTEENYSLWVKNEQERIRPQQATSLDSIIQSASARTGTSNFASEAIEKPVNAPEPER